MSVEAAGTHLRLGWRAYGRSMTEQHATPDHEDDATLDETNERLQAESIQGLGTGEPNRERPDQPPTQVRDDAAQHRDDTVPPAGVNG
ncbi:hypothetical protein C5C17_10370 [Pseudoclavibacter sp. RFBA6]|nr:hypothetical protein C5C17_10370 [Pseudoclavibacter sp. RFBA6]